MGYLVRWNLPSGQKLNILNRHTRITTGSTATVCCSLDGPGDLCAMQNFDAYNSRTSTQLG